MTDIATRVHDHTWRIDPDRPLAARHRLLQAPDAADRASPPPRRAGEVQPDQPLGACAAGQADRRGRPPRTARPRPRADAEARRVDMAARQHLLRQALDVRPGLHGLARRLPAAGVPAGPRRRPVRADLRGLVAGGDDVGDPRARGADGAALAGGDGDHGQVRAARALRPRHGAALGEGRAAAQAAGPADLGLRHPPAALVPVAELVRGGDDRGPGRALHRLVQLLRSR